MIPTGKVAKSMWLRANYPANKSSKTKRATICNFGINDADYVVSPKINGSREPCPAYATWRGMIQRCVDPDYKNMRPAYKDVTVWHGWQRFMAFRRWWLCNYVEGWELDKDIFSDVNKIYSPSTCIFIPQWLNVFLTERPNSDTPKGVFYEEQRRKFKASVKYENKTINIGRFETQEQALSAYTAEKIRIAEARRWEIEPIRGGIFDRVIAMIKEGQ
jgi:hypothetical protein